MAAAVRRLSPVIITVLIPMRRSSAKRSLMPPFTMSFSSITPSTRAVLVASATTSGVEPRRATVSTSARTSLGNGTFLEATQAATASAAPLRIERSGRSTPLMRVCAEKRMNVPPSAATSRSPQAERGLREHDDAPPFRRLVGERGKLRGVGQLLRRHARRR